MTELIVLGTIPGTNIQINFTFWVYLSIAVITCALLAGYWRHRRVFHHWLAGYVLAYVLAHTPMQPRQTA